MAKSNTVRKQQYLVTFSGFTRVLGAHDSLSAGLSGIKAFYEHHQLEGTFRTRVSVSPLEQVAGQHLHFDLVWSSGSSIRVSV